MGFVTRLREWLVRLWSTLGRRRSDEDLEQELRLHLELAAADERRRSASDGDARRAAAIRHGGLAQTMAALREQRGLPWLDEIGRDVRYTIRGFRRSPAFTVVALATLALGIGASTAIYSVVGKILLQPLPFPDSDRLVRVVENIPHPLPGRPPIQAGFTYQELEEWQARSRTLTDVMAFAPLPALVRTADGAARLWGSMISTNAFAALNVHAIIGRTFTDDDQRDPDVVIISQGTWRRLFHSDPRVIGAALEFQDLNGDIRGKTVIGVLPDGFEFPISRNSAFYTEFYTPLIPSPGATMRTSGLVARLRPGVSLQAAHGEANVIGDAIRPPRPPDAPPLTVARFDVQVLEDQIVGTLRPALRLLLVAVGILLAIVCANVANLLLARGTARQRELAVRFAIGASRGRVVRQLVTECLVLAGMGGVLGAALGAAGVTLVKRLATVGGPGIFRLMFGDTILPRGQEIGIDAAMFGTAFGIAAMTAIVFGLLPALHLSRVDQLHVMGAKNSGSARGAARLRTVLVIGQLVMATVLLVGAGLFATSFVKLTGVDRGYDADHVLALQLVLPSDYSIARKAEVIDTTLARLRAAPDVAAAGFSRAGVLIAEEITQGTFVPPGRSLQEMRGHPGRFLLRPVSPGFLTAMGVPLLAGRELEATDDATSAPVIVISRSVARQYFELADPVGQFVDWHVGTTPPVRMQIVGVVEDLRNLAPDREASAEIFLDYRQLLTLQQAWGDSIARQDMRALGLLSFAVRTRGDSAAAIPAVSHIVRGVDANAGIDALVPLPRLVASSVARPRFYAVLLGVFAIVAGLLAAVGVYGVLACAVVQRTQEIGVRMALGARRAQVLALVLRTGVMLTTIGVVLGLLSAAAGTRLLQGLLFGISPLDPATFAAVAFLFALVSIVACYVPAWRATKVDPVVALRSE